MDNHGAYPTTFYMSFTAREQLDKINAVRAAKTGRRCTLKSLLTEAVDRFIKTESAVQ